jgi:hypothetical protein
MKKKIGNALFLQFIQNEIGGINWFKNLSRKEKVNYKRKMTAWYNRPANQEEDAKRVQETYKDIALALGMTVDELKQSMKNITNLFLEKVIYL